MATRFTMSTIPAALRVTDAVTPGAPEPIGPGPRRRHRGSRLLAVASSAIMMTGLLLAVAAPVQAAECGGGPYSAGTFDLNALPSTCRSVSVHVTVKWVKAVKGDIVNITRFGPATGYPEAGLSYWARAVKTTSQPGDPDPLTSDDWFYYKGNDTVVVGEAVDNNTSQQWAALGDYTVRIACTFTAAGSTKAAPVKLGKVTAKIPATLSTAPL